MEVVDVEVKITSMQGTHLYKRDQTMQVTKCLLWTNNIQPHPTIVKKMKTFLEVENKMGTMIQSSRPINQTRPPLPITNPNVNRSDNAERRKTIMPKRKFRPVTAANPPVSQVPPKPNYKIPPTAARTSTPWPGAGRTAGSITDDRQWLLPNGYPAIQDKNNDNDISSPKENAKPETPIISEGPKKEKCGWGPNCPFCKVQEKKEENPQNRPLPNPQTQKPTKTKSQLLWEAEMERLNEKYNLDCYLDSELDSESDKGEEYHYEHGYETLI